MVLAKIIKSLNVSAILTFVSLALISCEQDAQVLNDQAADYAFEVSQEYEQEPVSRLGRGKGQFYMANAALSNPSVPSVIGTLQVLSEMDIVFNDDVNELAEVADLLESITPSLEQNGFIYAYGLLVGTIPNNGVMDALRRIYIIRGGMSVAELAKLQQVIQVLENSIPQIQMILERL